MINILHIGNIRDTQQSGVAIVVPKIISSQSKIANVALLNINQHNASDSLFPNFGLDDFKTITQLPSPFNRPDIVIFHEVYRSEFIKLYKWLLRHNIPYVILPHGSLTTEAQSESKFKKIIGNFFIFNRFIKNATAIQYLSYSEKKRSLSNMGHRSIIRGNGIDLKKQYKQSFSTKSVNFIYVGRLDIKIKGLDVFVKAIHLHAALFRQKGATATILGADAKNGLKKLRAMVDALGIADIVEIGDAIYGDQKISRIIDADVFVQVSKTEAQSLALMEAMSLGMPCITSPGSAFYDENHMGIAIDTDGSVESVGKAMACVINKRIDLYDISRRARQYIIKNTLWNVIAEKTIISYLEILQWRD